MLNGTKAILVCAVCPLALSACGELYSFTSMSHTNLIDDPVVRSGVYTDLAGGADTLSFFFNTSGTFEIQEDSAYYYEFFAIDDTTVGFCTNTARIPLDDRPLDVTEDALSFSNWSAKQPHPWKFGIVKQHGDDLILYYGGFVNRQKIEYLDMNGHAHVEFVASKSAREIRSDERREDQSERSFDQVVEEVGLTDSRSDELKDTMVIVEPSVLETIAFELHNNGLLEPRFLLSSETVAQLPEGWWDKADVEEAWFLNEIQRINPGLGAEIRRYLEQ